MAESNIILITGANTGIGLEVVRALCASSTSYDIILSGRSLDKVNAAVTTVQREATTTTSKLHALQLDIEDDASIAKAFDLVQSNFGRLDALVNNAGAQIDMQLATGALTERAMWNKSWDVNVTGSQVLTSTFAPLLLQSTHPRLLFVTSGTATLTGAEQQTLPLDKFAAPGWPKQGLRLSAYRSVKTGLNMVMREWHRLLHDDGVKVFCISPGMLVTGLGENPEMIRKMGGGDASLGGSLIRSVLEGERDQDVGKVVTRGGVQAW